jgi:hypothetical protein
MANGKFWHISLKIFLFPKLSWDRKRGRVSVAREHDNSPAEAQASRCWICLRCSRAARALQRTSQDCNREADRILPAELSPNFFF